MAEPTIEVAIARVETKIESLRADLARYLSELSNQEERLRKVEQNTTRNSERIRIFSIGMASLQIIIVAIATWIGSR